MPPMMSRNAAKMGAVPFVLSALVFASSLGGCVSITSPVVAGKDTYMIGLGAHGGFSSDADLLAQTIQSAGTFCTAQHRMVEVITTSSTGTQGWTPQSNQVLFRCVAL
jgi:hypothetical protein